MAVRSIIGANKARNGNFELSPGNTPMTSGLGRWIDGTAGGSTTVDTYRWYCITGVGSMAYSFDSTYSRSGSNSLKIDLTNATARGRVMSAPFESTTTKDLVTRYGIHALPSTSYTLTAYAASINALASTGKIVLQQYDINGTLISSPTTNSLPVGNNDWTLLSTTLTTNASTAYFVINCNCNTAGQAQTYWFDDIVLNKTVPDTRTTATSRTLATNRVAVRDMGTALSFDGAGDYVRRATPFDHVVQNNPMAFSFWFFNRETDDGTILANRIDDTTGNLHFGWRNSQNRIEGAFFATGSIYTGRFASPVLAKNTWYHVTIVYDGTTLNTGTNGVDIYINGILQPKVSTNYGGAGNVTNFTLGGKADATATNSFAGILDNFRTWNRALTAAEVSNMYFNNIVPRSGLVAEYLFNETTGTTALDTSGNGNSGTITGATYTLDVPLKLRTVV